MQILHSLKDAREWIQKMKKEGKTIGFIPTMGYLHQGHLKLVEEARIHTHYSVVTIFINPAQFNDPEDLKKYPMDIEGDIEKCKNAQVDLLILPSYQDVYPDGIPHISIQIPHLMNGMCGKSRPGHFEGVLLVLSKFFHMIEPDFLFMGKKDYQQYKIVEYYIQHLNFPIQVIGVETVREQDGLAMSSRNVRLNPKERETALLIYRTLNIAERVWNDGERNLHVFREILLDVLASDPLLKLDYMEFVDVNSLQPVEDLSQPFLIAIAAYVGNVRLIDNKEIGVRNSVSKVERFHP